MTSNITAKEKYGFSEQEIIAYIITTKSDLLRLKTVAKHLANNFSDFIKKNRKELSTTLGIQNSTWDAANNKTDITEYEQVINDIRYRQVGKYVIIKVIEHIIVESVTFKQDASIALTKIKLAVNLFDPLPDLPLDEAADETHKEAANQITRKEIRRIEELLDVRDLSGRSSQ